MSRKFVKFKNNEIKSGLIDEKNIVALYGYIPTKEVLKSDSLVEVMAVEKDLSVGQFIEIKGLKVEDEKVVYGYEIIEDLNIAKQSKIDNLNALFLAKSTRPIVETSLGFSVDGSETDLTLFSKGKDRKILTVMDAYDKSHTIELADYDVIIKAIEDNQFSLLQEKWSLKAQINACATATEVDAIDISGAFGTAVADED